ncbi:MAG: hypothetical protein ACUVV3_03895 [Dehalococcoidia bacterium]
MENYKWKAFARTGIACLFAAAVGLAALTAFSAPFLSTASPVASQQGPTVSIEDGVVPEGGTDVTRLWALNVSQPALCGFTVDIAYNPLVKIPTKCVADPAKKFDTKLCNKDGPGYVRVIGASATGVSGNIPLADITWTAAGSAGDSTPLDVRIVSFKDCASPPAPITPVAAADGVNRIIAATPGPPPIRTPRPSATPTATTTPPPISTATPTAIPDVSMPLVLGWNHSCYIGDEKGIEDALGAISQDVLAVYILRPSQEFDRWFPNRTDLSTIVTLHPYDQLFLLMSAATTWPQQAATASQESLDLAQGWNGVCYTGQLKPVQDAAAGIDGSVAVIYMIAGNQTWLKYVPGRPDLSDIFPMQMYDSVLVLVTEEGGARWTFHP